MDYLERTVFYKLKNFPYHWYRFIDDVWCIFDSTEVELNTFLQDLNQCHSTIKFTFNYSKAKVTFLDTVTRIERNRIITIPHKKEYEPFCLDHSSCHPLKNKQSIPRSQFMRIWRISSYWYDYFLYSQLMRIDFVCRGYPNWLIKRSMLEVMDPYHDRLLPLREQIYCIINYNPTNPAVKEIIQKY